MSKPGETASTGKKRVYLFGGGKADGTAGMKELLGGKGANLAEMASLGLPVPPGFTITTEVCTAYYTGGRKLPDGLEQEVEARAGARRQDRRRDVRRRRDPAARLGALRRARVHARHDGHHPEPRPQRRRPSKAWPAKSGNERFAYDSYRRFIQMYANVVLGVDHGVFEDILENHKNLGGVTLDTELGADDWLQDHRRLQGGGGARRRTSRSRRAPPSSSGAPSAPCSARGTTHAPRPIAACTAFPTAGARRSTCRPWCSATWATTSATGVAFTRNPSTGAREVYGEFLINAQGEDVVAGIRTPQPLTEAARNEGGAKTPSLEAAMPDTYGELVQVFELLEKHYRDMQDIEFTIQEGKLWMLQTRSGKRTTKAALKIAVDLVAEGLIAPEEAVLRIDAASLDQLLHPTIDPAAERLVVATGLPASPGAASGEIVFDADEAEALKGHGREGNPRAHRDAARRTSTACTPRPASSPRAAA